MRKEIVKIALKDIVLEKNVRHAHLWEVPFHSPNDIDNYNSESIRQMAITFVENFLEGQPIFDNEPWLFFCPKIEKYVVQSGNTRTITLMKYDFNELSEGEDEIFNSEEVKRFILWKDNVVENEGINFIVVNRRLEEAEKRRENTVRSQQHWLSVATMYANELGLKSATYICRKEGISKKKFYNYVTAAQDLTPRMVSFVSRNLIFEVPAIKIAREFGKKNQDEIVDYLEAHPEELPIKSVRAITKIVEQSYYVLPSDYPRHSFLDANMKQWPIIEKEDWYVNMSEGMFQKEISKSEAHAKIRFEAWKELKVKEIMDKYPNAKVLKKATKNMEVTKQKECGHAEPYIAEEYKLVWVCTSNVCPVHASKEEFVQKEKTKVQASIYKSQFKNAMNWSKKNKMFIGNLAVILIYIDFLYSRLSVASKKEAMTYLFELCGTKFNFNHDLDYTEDIKYLKKIINPKDFSFFNILKNKEEPEWFVLYNYFSLRISYSFEEYLGFLFVTENAHMKSWTKAFFDELKFDEDEEEITFDDFSIEVNVSEAAIEQKYKEQFFKKNKYLNFVQYNLPGVQKKRGKQWGKGYVKCFGKRINLSEHLYYHSRIGEFGIDGFTQEKQLIVLRALLNAMGVKKVKEIEDDALWRVFDNRYFELSDIFVDDEDYKKKVEAYEENILLVNKIRADISVAAMDDKKLLNEHEVSFFETMQRAAIVVNKKFRKKLLSPIGFSPANNITKDFLVLYEKGELTMEDIDKMSQKWANESVVLHALESKTPLVEGAIFEHKKQKV